MNLFKLMIIGIFFIFLFSFITHNIYDWFPSTLTSLLFPVNESIWEHQKMIYITFLIWGLIELIFIKNDKIKHHNFILSIFASPLIAIIIFILVYTPIFLLIGHNMTITLIIYFIVIVIAQYCGYRLLRSKINYSTLNKISLFFIPIIFFILAWLTYHPLPIKVLFYDQYKHKLGIYNVYQ